MRPQERTGNVLFPLRHILRPRDAARTTPDDTRWCLALALLATVWVLVVGTRYLGALHALADRNAVLNCAQIKFSWRLFASTSTPSTRRLLDGEPARRRCLHPTHWLISTQVIQMRLRNTEQARRSRAAAKDSLPNEHMDEEGLGIDSDALAWDARRYLKAPQWWSRFLDVATELVMPLLRPIATIDTIVVAPVRRTWIDGRAKFFRMRCKVAHKHGVAPASTAECDLKILNQAYRVFCPKKKLRADAFATVGDLQRYLVANHNLRLRTHKLPRLSGRVWTAAPEFVSDARPLVEHARCFEAAAAVWLGVEQNSFC